MNFLETDTLEAAREKLLAASHVLPLQTEAVSLQEAVGRVLAEDIRAAIHVPSFRKSTVDGYAVRAKDTQGAGDSIPCFLTITGEVHIGHGADAVVGPGACVYVPTGGMLPEGADAVVMVEYTELFDATQAAVYQAVSPGRNVIQTGEDVREGTIVLKRGQVLRPQDIGVLAALGMEKAPVYGRLRITILSTGDELVAAGEALGPGQIYDINTWGLLGQCSKAQLQAVDTAVLRDDETVLRDAVSAAMTSSDILVVSGGSSKGRQDFTASVLDALASPGVFTHGIALKPGKPTILGVDEDSRTLLCGLPGHPVAAMVVFDLLLDWALRQRMGVPEPVQIQAQMEVNVPGGSGRTVCQMVQLTKAQAGAYRARPLLGKSGLITSLAGADGYVMIAADKEGLKKGETVVVTPL